MLPELLRFGYSSFISQAIAPLSKTMTTAHVSVRPFPAVPGLRSWTPPAVPATPAVIRLVRMAEHGDLRPGLLRGVHERIESAVFNAVGVPMADESLHGAERDDVGVGCVGGDIAVAAHGVERYLREFLAQDRGVAGVVAEMDYQVGAGVMSAPRPRP